MKASLITVLVILVAAFNVYAQSEEDSLHGKMEPVKLRYGISGAAGIHNILYTGNGKWSDNLYQFHRAGGSFYAIGGHVEIPVVKPYISTLIEVNYSDCGITSFTESWMLDLVVNYNTLEIPIILKGYFPTEKATLFFGIGAIHSSVINSEGYVLYTDLYQNVGRTTDITPDNIIGGRYTGLLCSCGSAIKLPKGFRLTIEARLSRYVGREQPAFDYRGSSIHMGLNRR